MDGRVKSLPHPRSEQSVILITQPASRYKGTQLLPHFPFF